MDIDKELTKATEIGNVSDKVIESFIKELASDDEYTEISDRLKDVVFAEKPSEKLLRSALFPEEVE